MENLDKLKIGEFINSRREYLKITQEDLGEKLGVTDEDVSEWEEGQKIPDINLLPSLANILDVSIDELLIQKNKESFKHNKNNKILIFMICLLIILNIFFSAPSMMSSTSSVGLYPSSIISLAVLINLLKVDFSSTILIYFIAFYSKERKTYNQQR